MITISNTEIPGVRILNSEQFRDHRGEFSRLYSTEDFMEILQGENIVQVNHAVNYEAGTIRGLHLQTSPSLETKIVRCIAGSVFDVAVDLRPTSPTYCKWFGLNLDPSLGQALVIPPGCAHGYQTLVEGAELIYMHTALYDPNLEQGFRFDDPAFGIQWPLQAGAISKRDQSFQLLGEHR